MNALLSLLTLAASLSGCCDVEALPQEPSLDVAKKIEISFSGDEKNYKYDGETEEREGGKRRRPPVPRESGEEMSDADKSYIDRKRKLDEEFKIMFELKKQLDSYQGAMSAKWEEYYALSRAYNEELQKLVSSWVTDNLYD